MTYPVSALDDSGMACRVTSTAKSGRYTLDHRLLHRPAARQRRDAHPAAAAQAAGRAAASTPGSTATINGNGGGGAARERRRRRRRHRHLHRITGAGLHRHRHRDDRGEPRLRPAGLRRAARRPAVPGRLQRLRRHRQRRPRPARRRPPARHHLRERDRTATSCRRRSSTSAAADRPPWRWASAPPRPPRWPPPAPPRTPIRTGRSTTTSAAGRRYDKRPERPRPPAAGLPSAQRKQLAPHLLPVRERAEGQRGQDLPRRGRRVARQPVGAGGRGRRPGADLLRLLPRGLRPRPVRDLHRAARLRRRRHREGHRALPVRAAAAARRLDAAQQPGQRQDRARHASACSSTRSPTRS